MLILHTSKIQSVILSIFSHPDFTVGFGISACADHQISRTRRVADFTAGREFHKVTLPRRTFCNFDKIIVLYMEMTVNKNPLLIKR